MNFKSPHLKLISRQIVSLFLGFVFLIFFASRLDPKSYGYFSGYMLIFFFFSIIGTLGLNIQIIRSGEISYFSYVNSIKKLIRIIPFAAVLIYGIYSFVSLSEIDFIYILVFSLASSVSSLYALLVSALEVQEKFGLAGIIETIIQITNYSFSIVVYITTKSDYALLWGIFGQTMMTFLAILFIWLKDISNRKSEALINPSLRNGIEYIAATATWQLRPILFSIMIPVIYGSSVLAATFLTLKLIDALLFFRGPIQRSLSSRLANLLRKEIDVIPEFKSIYKIQTLIILLIIILFPVIGIFLGKVFSNYEKFDLPQMIYLSLLPSVVYALVGPITSYLYILGKARVMVVTHILNVLIFLSIYINTDYQNGLKSFAISEIFASVSFFLPVVVMYKINRLVVFTLLRSIFLVFTVWFVIWEVLWNFLW